MSMIERVIEGLPEENQKLLNTYVKDVKALFADQLEGVLLYGSAVRGEFLPGRSNLNLLLLVSSYDQALLKGYEAIHRRWSKEQIVAPLFLTEAELRSSASVFPLEYLEIQEQHRVLGGRDPFVGFHIEAHRLATEVQQGLMAAVLRLRQRYVEGNATEEAALILLPLSITSLLPLLRGIQRMQGRAVKFQSEELIKDVEEQLKLDLRGLHDALLLKRGQITPGPKEIPRLFERYLHTVTALANSVVGLVREGNR
jgi:predicted nucleotidyltransferase